MINSKEKCKAIMEAIKLHKQDWYDKGFKAGLKKGRKQWEGMCKEFNEIIKRRQIEISALRQNIFYQLESLNTTELKDKAPLCWEKLQQVIEKLKELFE